MTLLATETGNRKHKKEDRGQNLYQTPPVAVRALLQVEDIPQAIWEPCCGPGSIVRELRAAGRKVFASDLIDYGWDHKVRDFYDYPYLLKESNGAGDNRPWICPNPEMILTNPPYDQHTEKFMNHALTLCPRVTVLMRTGWISSKRWERSLKPHLARVWQFAPRLPVMHREGFTPWTGKKNENSAMDFAWFVFERDFRFKYGKATIDWINPREVA